MNNKINKKSKRCNKSTDLCTHAGRCQIGHLIEWSLCNQQKNRSKNFLQFESELLISGFYMNEEMLFFLNKNCYKF